MERDFVMVKNIFVIFAFFISLSSAQPKSVTAAKNESSITYYLVHPLHKIEATCNDVLTLAMIDAKNKSIKSVSTVVDVTTFDSGNSNRDSHAMEVIDALSFPEARFVSFVVATQGDSVFVKGKLTFHGITHDVTIAAISLWTATSVKFNGGFTISLTQFQIERPSLLMVPVEDDLRFTLQAVFHF